MNPRAIEQLGMETVKGTKITVDSAKNWTLIVTNVDKQSFHFPTILSSFNHYKEHIKSMCLLLLKKHFVRCDYKELVKLTLEYVMGHFNEKYDFQCPGTLHRARWMAKLVYSIKIVLFSNCYW